MNIRSVEFYFISVFLFFPVTLYASPKNSSPKRPTCMTSECHGDLRGGVSIHGPIKAKGCTVCHELDKKPLPKTAQGKTKKDGDKKDEHIRLVKIDIDDVNKLCFVCHEELEAKLKHPKSV